MATAADRAQAEAELRDLAYTELVRVVRALSDHFGQYESRVQIELAVTPSGEPLATIRARDGFDGISLARILELAGPELEVALDGAAIVYSCPSWPDPPF